MILLYTTCVTYYCYYLLRGAPESTQYFLREHSYTPHTPCRGSIIDIMYVTCQPSSPLHNHNSSVMIMFPIYHCI